MKFSWQILGLALIKDVIRKYLYNILCVSLFKIYCVYDINLYRANHGCSRRHFNPFIPSGIFYLSLWTGPFLTKGVCFAFLVLSCFTEISVFNANSVDPIRCHVVQLLIWIFTVCQCPLYGTSGIKGLILF